MLGYRWQRQFDSLSLQISLYIIREWIKGVSETRLKANGMDFLSCIFLIVHSSIQTEEKNQPTEIEIVLLHIFWTNSHRILFFLFSSGAVLWDCVLCGASANFSCIQKTHFNLWLQKSNRIRALHTHTHTHLRLTPNYRTKTVSFRVFIWSIPNTIKFICMRKKSTAIARIKNGIQRYKRERKKGKEKTATQPAQTRAANRKKWKQ